MAAEPTNEDYRKALSLALKRLAVHEPNDSRMVSDEFVALACIQSGQVSSAVMAIIDKGLEDKPS